MKTDPAPAYQVSARGECFALGNLTSQSCLEILLTHSSGTLKTFKWKPLDTKHPEKGMVLFYQNGQPT